MQSHSRGALAPVPHPTESRPGSPRLIRPDIRPPSHRWRWIAGIVFIGLLVVGGLAYMRSLSRPAARPAAAIRTATVRVDSIKKTVRLSGVTVAGRFSMLLTPSLRGTRSRGHDEFQQILLSTATPGSMVRKGDIVAEFERLYMLRRLDDYRAVVTQSEANLRSLNAILDVRRTNYDQLRTRYRGARDKAALDLRKAPVLSAINAEKNRLTHDQYEAQLKEIIAEEKFFIASERASIRRSELSLAIAKKELERAERNADAMLVKAPLDGMVVMQTIRRGSDNSEIRPGDQLHPGHPYMQIVDTSSMAVMATVNQVDVDLIRVGAPARVYFDAFPGLELPARVVSIGGMANSRGWRGNYVRDVAVRLALEKLDPRVIPNFSVAADVVLDSADNVPAVPLETVFTDPAEGATFAFVRGASGWEKRDVELGLANSVLAEVKTGLAAGDVVAAEWPLAGAAEQSAGPR